MGVIRSIIGQTRIRRTALIMRKGKFILSHQHSRIMTKHTLFPLLAMAAALPLTAQVALDTGRIEQLTGLKGALNKEEGVFKITAPRNDVKVAVDGWNMPPFMGLTSWAAFADGKTAEAMVMGDLVLFQDEVNPVMSAALDSGLTITALHNHFFYDEPKV